MTLILREKYKNEPWFPEIERYLADQFFYLQDRLIQSFRYVKLHSDNGKVFSYEYSSILRDSGGTFSSLIDKIIRYTQPEIQGELNISHFRDFLKKDIPNISHQSISVRPLFPLLLIPFSAFSNPNGKPKWWISYNNIKHSDIDNFKDGNLKNVMNAVGGLALLAHSMAIISSTPLFVNIGMVYSSDSIDVQPNRLLFFESEESS